MILFALILILRELVYDINRKELTKTAENVVKQQVNLYGARREPESISRGVQGFLITQL